MRSRLVGRRAASRLGYVSVGALVALTLLIAVVLVTCRPPAARAAVTLQLYGQLGQVTNGYARNATGTVVGDTGSFSARRGYTDSDGGGAVTPLPPLGTYAHAFARDVNASGHVVGFGSTVSQGFPGTGAGDRAFVYANGTMTELPTLPGSRHTQAYSINDAGVIVGHSTWPFRYANGTMTQIGLGGTGTALRVNTAGDIVGASFNTASERRAFLHRNGTSIELPLPSGFNSAEAVGINEAGDTIVGTVFDSTAPPLTLNSTGFVYRNGQATALPTLGGWFGQATDVNDHGQVVGTTSTASGETRAFVYQDGVLTDLNTLLPPGTTAVLRSAWSIDNAGWIIGNAADGSERYGFALQAPIPEPGSVALAALACALAAGRRHRQRQRAIRSGVAA